MTDDNSQPALTREQILAEWKRDANIREQEFLAAIKDLAQQFNVTISIESSLKVTAN